MLIIGRYIGRDENRAAIYIKTEGNKMKIYAKQVPPEHQVSPIDFFDEWPENVYVFGNRHYIEHGGETIEKLISAMYDAADELKRLMMGGISGYYSFIDIIQDYLPAPEHKNEYSRADRLEWRKLLLWHIAGALTETDAATAALKLITGRDFHHADIHGCCQGDWQEIIYPAEYGREWLEAFETEYFNTGTEWQINECTPDSDDNYYFYAHGWNNDVIRAEIADAAGCDPSDVVLYEFDGWSRTPEYREATV